MSFQLFADSACDLPLSFFEEHQVTLIPLRVHLNDHEYEDIKTIQSKEIFEAIRNGNVPKTSQASPQLLMELFTDLAKKGEKGLYIAFSSELSGTYQTAVMIRAQVKEDYPDLDLDIIDSKCASIGYGLVVLHAANRIKEGATKDEIIKEVQFRCQHMEHIFTVEDLDYLAKGGRVSKTSAVIGGLLNIKPILHVEDGKLIPIDKVRGRKKLFRTIIELMKQRGDKLDQQLIGISHGDDEESALQLKQLIQDEFGTSKFYIQMIGSAVGAHAGPGTLAVFFLNQMD
jgi:DegV family protein with EDD domain